MIQPTQGIVLRAVKYGETSLICTIFTRLYGVQSYLVQGIRTAGKKGHSRAGLLQPATLLDMVVYHKGQSGLQRIKEFTPAHIYRTVQEEIVKNSIALFSTELLLRLLPETAPAPELYDFTHEYFILLDEKSSADVANFPLFFLVQCSRYLGYELHGAYTEETPYLNLQDGRFSAEPPLLRSALTGEDAAALSRLLALRKFSEVPGVAMNGGMRERLLDWFLQFLQRHTDHMTPLKSLPVLQAVLRG